VIVAAEMTTLLTIPSRTRVRLRRQECALLLLHWTLWHPARVGHRQSPGARVVVISRLDRALGVECFLVNVTVLVALGWLVVVDNQCASLRSNP